MAKFVQLLTPDGSTSLLIARLPSAGTTEAARAARIRDHSQNAMALAIHSSQPVHRDDVSSRRAGDDRVARPGVDREVRRRAVGTVRC